MTHKRIFGTATKKRVKNQDENADKYNGFAGKGPTSIKKKIRKVKSIVSHVNDDDSDDESDDDY
jgi:hypothetical protein